jgi:hypothetical protein
VVFVSVPADGPAAAAAATISEYVRAGATHIAVNAAERDADLERFVGFLAHQVAPLVDDHPQALAEQQDGVGGEPVGDHVVVADHVGQGPGEAPPQPFSREIHR